MFPRYPGLPWPCKVPLCEFKIGTPFLKKQTFTLVLFHAPWTAHVFHVMPCGVWTRVSYRHPCGGTMCMLSRASNTHTRLALLHSPALEQNTQYLQTLHPPWMPVHSPLGWTCVQSCWWPHRYSPLWTNSCIHTGRIQSSWSPNPFTRDNSTLHVRESHFNLEWREPIRVSFVY